MQDPSDKSPKDVSPERTLVDYFFLFLEKIWIIIIFLVLGLVYAQREVSQIPTVYQSRATIEVLRKAESVQGIANTQENVRMDLTATVAQKLNLDGLFFEVAGAPEFASMLPKATFDNVNQIEQAKWNLARQMNNWTSVSVRPLSPLIDITSTHQDPKVARDVIAVMLREYLELGSTKRAGDSAATLRMLSEQIDEIRGRLSKSEQSLLIYNRALQIRDAIRASEAKIREMEKVYLPKWPPLVQEKAHRQTLIQSFSEELQRITDQSEQEYAFWRDEIEKNGDISGEARFKFQLQTAEARNNMLNREHLSDTRLYESLLNKLNMGTVESEYKPSEIAVLQPPILPPGPSPVNKLTYYLKFGFLAGALGAGLALFLGTQDNRIRRLEELERVSNTKVIAAIPKSSKLNSGLVSRSNSVEYESFRTLHTNNILDVPKGKIIMVTSSIPKEGKSTISCNLAAIAASWGWGEKVLLVDFDLRKPKVHEYLKLPETTKGVGDYLKGKASINECIIQHKDIPALFIMTAGVSRFEGSLPDQESLVKMLDLLKGNFERIIIDSAPVLAVNDTLVLGKHVDEICLVFRMWKTPRKALIRSLTQLSQNNTYPFGMVGNFMPRRKGLGQYGYYYSYTGSGYQSYGSEEPKPVEKPTIAARG